MLFTDGVISRDAFDNCMYIHTIKALTMKHDQRDSGSLYPFGYNHIGIAQMRYPRGKIGVKSQRPN